MMTKTIPSEGLTKLLTSLPDLAPNDRSLIERAYVRAETAHAGQTRRNGEPYFTHCLAVAMILTDLRLDAEAVAAALLHDVVEDTNVPLEEIAAEFGPSVALIVQGVTKLRNLPELPPGDRRSKATADRNSENLRKMALAMNEDVRVVLVKLADRLHNMRTLGFMPPEKQRRIAQETLDIYAPLANRLGIWQFKWELEDLSFRYLNEEKYREIAHCIDERRADRTDYLDKVIATLRRELERGGITTALISARPKHIYSIHRKMERKEVDFEHIYDVRAVRIILETVPQCYQALGIVHNLWHPVPGEFDDYIAAPKENFYRSLHTAVRDDNGKTLEVQMRTMEMHEHAEYGIAAHWRYKEGRKGHQKDKAFEERLSQIRRMMEFTLKDDDHDPRPFVEKLKTEMFQDRIYIFTPKGDVHDLMNGATPIDFAYHVHTDIGHRCRGARVNGRLVPLDYKLKTGDQVEIITQNNGRPSLDWLNPDLGYANTTRAQSKIRHWFRKQNRDRSITDGRELLERTLRRLGVLDKVTVGDVAAGLRFEKPEDLLAEIGTGGVTAPQIAHYIQEREKPQAPPDERAMLVERPTLIPNTGTTSIHIQGASGMLINLANCCKPVRGDRVVGFVTRGQGVRVHRADCVNIKGEKERLIDVEWGQTEVVERFSVTIEIVGFDRKGLLHDITQVISNESLNMTDVNVQTRQNIATCLLTLEILGLPQLTRVCARLEGIKSVTEVRRKNNA